MPEFHDYSKFVFSAYLLSALFLIIFALFSWIQLKNNEIPNKNQTKKTAKD